MGKRTDDLRFCVEYLASERYGDEAKAKAQVESLADEDELFEAYRSMVNAREPLPAEQSFLDAQDRMLKTRIASSGITNAEDLPRVPFDERMSLWRGDITTLEIDAIVNAANSQLLGCWVPGHYCIDNAIHTFAGIQLRAECARLMDAQGYPEPTGMAKITPAYNLLCKWVIHTVGPIASGHPTDLDRALLADCYRSCLAAAREVDANGIAFCCISTGVFGFPQREAAEIAVRTVKDWLDREGSQIHVVFNVFGEKDESIYRELLY